MSFNVEPLKRSFGAIVTGIDLAMLDPADFAELYRTWLKYSLLILPGQNLAKEEQDPFASRFGSLEFKKQALTNMRKDGTVRDPHDDDMMKVLADTGHWHLDSTYMPIQAKGAVFTAHIVPSAGGETAWADTAAAYEALSTSMKRRIEGLSAFHFLSSGKNLKEKDSEYFGYGVGGEPLLRPLVKIHPETGRPGLTIGRHVTRIDGLSEADSDELLAELMDVTCQPSRTYVHSWTPGDLVIWDNRCLLHKACPWDMREPRLMFHSRIAGHPVSELAVM